MDRTTSSWAQDWARRVERDKKNGLAALAAANNAGPRPGGTGREAGAGQPPAQGEGRHSGDLVDSVGKADAGDWGRPIPLDQEAQAPPFPLGALPGPLASFVEQGADALNCPVDYLAVAMLAMAGGAIGASRSLGVKGQYEERAALYAAIIGCPGDRKSPALALVKSPLDAYDSRHYQCWRSALEAHLAERDARDGRPGRSRSRRRTCCAPASPAGCPTWTRSRTPSACSRSTT